MGLMRNTERGSDLALCLLFHVVQPAAWSQMACQCGPALEITKDKRRCHKERKVQETEGKPGQRPYFSDSRAIKLGKESEVPAMTSSLPDLLKILGQQKLSSLASRASATAKKSLLPENPHVPSVIRKQSRFY